MNMFSDSSFSAVWVDHVLWSLRPAFVALAAGIPLAWILSRGAFSVPLGRAWLGVLYSFPMLGALGLAVGLLPDGERGLVAVLAVYALSAVAWRGAEGIRRIDPVALEACRGMGMSETRLFMLAKIPQSAPHFIDGFRLALLSSVALYALAGIGGQEGLGALVVRGLREGEPALALAGGLALCLTAVAFDQSLKMLAWSFSRYEGAVEPPQAAGRFF